MKLIVKQKRYSNMRKQQGQTEFYKQGIWLRGICKIYVSNSNFFLSKPFLHPRLNFHIKFFDIIKLIISSNFKEI